jgi:hypothetical protein
VVGAAARAGDHERRRRGAQAGGQGFHGGVVARELARDHVGRFGGLGEHQGGFGLTATWRLIGREGKACAGRAHRRGRTAHHQLRHEALVVQRCRRIVVGVAGAAADQQARGVAGDVFGGLLGGGQRRPRLARERAVLETGDGQVVGHVHAGRLGRGQHAGGDFVVGTEDGGRRFAQRQQAARAAEAVVEGVVALHHQVLVTVMP